MIHMGDDGDVANGCVASFHESRRIGLRCETAFLGCSRPAMEDD
jgi:hypothetical protein